MGGRLCPIALLDPGFPRNEGPGGTWVIEGGWRDHALPGDISGSRGLLKDFLGTSQGFLRDDQGLAGFPLLDEKGV